MTNTLRMSEEEYAAHVARQFPGVKAWKEPTTGATVRAISTIRAPKMNLTEQAYAEILAQRKQAGELLWYEFEAITLRLAHDTRYTPDFAVILASGQLELHEVKGPFVREDSFIKIKVAARLFPFRFLFCQRASKKDGRGWAVREIQP